MASVTSLRASAVRGWVSSTFAERKAGHLTSAQAAAQATADLGFAVSRNRVVRELDRQGVTFRRVKGDPPKPVWSKVDLLRVRLDRVEKELAALRGKLVEAA